MSDREIQECSFWRKLIISGSGFSSKRFMGILCIIFAMVFAMFGFFFGDIGEVNPTVSTVLIEFLTAGVALFGVSVLDKRSTTKERESDKNYNRHNNNYYGEGKEDDSTKE